MISFNVTIFETLLGLLAVVLIDWALGILAAFRTGSFSLPYLYHQLEAQALPFGAVSLIGLLTSIDVNGQSIATGALVGVFAASSAVYLVKLGADILAKLNVVMSGGGAPAPAQTPPAA